MRRPARAERGHRRSPARAAAGAQRRADAAPFTGGAAATPADAPPAPTESTPEAPSSEIRLDDFTSADFELVQPKVSLLELDGYFRVRANALRKLDFGNDTNTEVPLSNEDPGRYPAGDDGEASYTGTDMRLRLAPTINITDRIAVMATLDAFDNLVLGSTPKVLAVGEGQTETNILARGQTTVNDALVLKHAWARVTALNDQLQLTVGRMPAHWGLGILSNAGSCLDCDFGDTVDRLALGFRAADLLFVLMYDWVSSGPAFQPFGRSGGQPIDLVPWDDVDQYSLRVVREDAPADITDMVLQGQTVLNYGLWAVWRKQNRDIPADVQNADACADGTAICTGNFDLNRIESTKGERRNANLVTGDGYLRLYTGELELGAEGAIIVGNFLDSNIEARETTSVFQYGGALEAFWRFRGDYQGTSVGLKAGGASGDKARGFGVLDRAGTQRGTLVNGRTDFGLNNFQFSPDYHVDLLLFRRVIGTVSDALYVRPEVAYGFDNNVVGSFAVMYAQAVHKASTPSARTRSTDPNDNQNASSPLGLELDLELSYGGGKRGERTAFSGSILGGVLFPFGGFKNYELADDPTADVGGGIAWTLQAHLNFVF